MRWFITCAILFAAALTFSAGVALAQEAGPTPSPDQVNAIARNLYCPVCANVPLDACGTPACARWRQQIADLLTQGYSAQQIYDDFVRQYGPSVLATPPANGFNWLIYLLPPAAVLIAAVLLVRGLSSWKKESVRTAAPLPEAADRKYARRLEDELKARK